MFKTFSSSKKFVKINFQNYVTDEKNSKAIVSRIAKVAKWEEMRKKRNLEKKNLKTMSKIQPKVNELQLSSPLSLSNFSNQLGVTTGLEKKKIFLKIQLNDQDNY